MTAELKSSDEILQELFGMCSKQSIDSSEESSQSESEVDDDASTKKHKKKKKKHKKNKKRSRSSSAESESSDRKTHKRKKKKSHKDDEKSKKLKVKIKSELGEPKLPSNDFDGIKKNDNVTDTTTGKKMTIDDVFNSLGIIPKSKIKTEKGITSVEIKKENGCDVKPVLVAEGPALPVLPPPPASSPNKVQLKVEKNTITNSNSSIKTNLHDVFDTEPNLLAEKNNTKTKKINIENLKNSCVYEAVIKEVEERERQKAEKYEEGELSSTSSSSQDELSDDNSLQPENEPDLKKKEKRRHKHKTRSKSKSHERSKSKHRSRSHHRKHSHEKTSHKDKVHKSRKSSVSPSRHSRSSKSYYDYHHHHHHHQTVHHRPHYHHYSRASSVEGRSNSRSRKSREEKRGTSNDRIHSRNHSKVTSKERKSRSKSTEKIDKQKLLEIARKNAITLLKQGALPASVVVNTKDKIASIKAGGKTVDELTDFCKQLSKKDAEGQESLSSGSDLDEEREKAFHHPFQLKERPSSIVMNIRNAVPLPTKTAQEKTLELSKQLSLQYPVSSGQHHRTSESEWVPVEKTPDPVPIPIPAPAPVVPAPPKITGSEPFHPLNYPLVSYPTINYNGYTNQIPLPQTPNVDIGSIVAERLEAIRRLTENPQDPIGNDLIQVADTKMKVWAESKVQPGLFTGSTGVRTLSAAELSSGVKAWPKKNQFIAAKPVVSDKGEALMKKMGWQPGEGLGKYKQGPPEPCEIAMKTDRKGLAEQTVTSFQQNSVMKKAFELSQNKHPVSFLNEYCSRKKIGTPQYDCEEKDGAGKRKLFLFSVTVKGMKYTPHMPCCNKKQSKIEAATLCLQNLGLLPTATG